MRFPHDVGVAPERPLILALARTSSLPATWETASLARSKRSLLGVNHAAGTSVRCGAASALLETIGGHRPAVIQDIFDHKIREALGDLAFADASAQGQAMTLEQAIEYALAGQTE